MIRTAIQTSSLEWQAPKTPRNNPEEQMQMALFDRIRMHEDAYPELRRIFHTPNGGSRGQRRGRDGLTEGQRMQRAGVRPGVVDIICCTAKGAWRGFAFELKAGRNRCTPEQDDWLFYFAGQDFLTGVYWDDWVQVWQDIKKYFGLNIKEVLR